VLGGQFLQSPPMRKLARVPDHEFVGIDTDLNGNGGRVIFVGHGVDDYGMVFRSLISAKTGHQKCIVCS